MPAVFSNSAHGMWLVVVGVRLSRLHIIFVLGFKFSKSACDICLRRLLLVWMRQIFVALDVDLICHVLDVGERTPFSYIVEGILWRRYVLLRRFQVFNARFLELTYQRYVWLLVAKLLLLNCLPLLSCCRIHTLLSKGRGDLDIGGGSDLY